MSGPASAQAMTDTGPAPLRLDEGDLALFAAASHDRNPLHLSDDYARKTPYGRRVAFGVLGALAALGRLRPRPGWALRRLALDFQAPLFVGIEYAVAVSDQAPERASVVVSDGPQVLLRGRAEFVPTAPAGAPLDAAASAAPRGEAADHPDDALTAGYAAEGVYAPDWRQARLLLEQFRLAERGVGAAALAALLWSSYLIGMELPGRRALYSRAAFTFTPADAAAPAAFAYRAAVQSFNRGFGLLKLAAALGEGEPWASADLWALVREELAPAAPGVLERLLPRSTALAGKTAFVVGASRGLGAALVRALASQGCTVYAGFARSRPEAERLRAAVEASGGRVELVQGDGADLAWCERVRRTIVERHGGLDLLLCNAFPALVPLRLHPAMVGRVNDYVARSIALVSVPLAATLDALAESGGRCVVVSSIYVETAPAEWPHYVAAKAAAEGLLRAAAAEYPAVRFLLVRPPRLLTDLANTPLGRQDALPPEGVAVAVVQRLLEPAELGAVAVLRSFPDAAP